MEFGAHPLGRTPSTGLRMTSLIQQENLEAGAPEGLPSATESLRRQGSVTTALAPALLSRSKTFAFASGAARTKLLIPSSRICATTDTHHAHEPTDGHDNPQCYLPARPGMGPFRGFGRWRIGGTQKACGRVFHRQPEVSRWARVGSRFEMAMKTKAVTRNPADL